MKFSLGQVVITRPALTYASKHKVDVLTLVSRHSSCDFGDLDAEDKALNIIAVLNGGRIFSAYNVANERWYVITEADRSSTCVMLAQDY